MSLNNCTLSGRVGTDPELRHLDNGTAVAKFRLAVNRPGKKDETDWFQVDVWGKSAESCAEYVRKGRELVVAGSVHLETWTGRDGKAGATLRLNCRDWQLVGSPPERQEREPARQSSGGYQRRHPDPAEDEIPNW